MGASDEHNSSCCIYFKRVRSEDQSALESLRTFRKATMAFHFHSIADPDSDDTNVSYNYEAEVTFDAPVSFGDQESSDDDD